MSFLNSLQNKSKKFDDPFLHWELDKPLTEEQINEIVKADIANPIEHDLNYDGTRAIDGGAPEFRKGLSHGGKALKFRCFITKDNSNEFPNLMKDVRDYEPKIALTDFSDGLYFYRRYSRIVKDILKPFDCSMPEIKAYSNRKRLASLARIMKVESKKVDTEAQEGLARRVHDCEEILNRGEQLINVATTCNNMLVSAINTRDYYGLEEEMYWY